MCFMFVIICTVLLQLSFVVLYVKNIIDSPAQLIIELCYIAGVLLFNSLAAKQLSYRAGSGDS